MELSAVDEEMLGSRRDRGAVEVDEPHVGAEHRERVRLDPVMRDAGASERVDRPPRPGEERVVDRLASPARDDRAGRVVGDEDRVTGRRLRRDEDLARRHPGPPGEERDQRLVLHRLDPAAAQTRAVVRVEGRPPGRLEELRVVGVATVDLDEERLAAGIRPSRDEDAGRLPVGRLEADDLDPELVESRDHVVGLGVPGRRAGGEPDDGRRDDRDEQRGDRPARRRGFDEDRAEEAEHEHPADEPLERADEVGDDGEDDRRGERDAKDGKRRGVDVEPQEIVELGPAARREPRRADRDRGGQDDRCERLEQDGGATAHERQENERDREQGEAVVEDRPDGLEPVRQAREHPDERALEGRRGEDGDRTPSPRSDGTSRKTSVARR